jgi:hypothetical protein
MKTHALSQHVIQDSMDRTQAEQLEQYTLWQIPIWASAALPMGLIYWVISLPAPGANPFVI